MITTKKLLLLLVSSMMILSSCEKVDETTTIVEDNNKNNQKGDISLKLYTIGMVYDDDIVIGIRNIIDTNVVNDTLTNLYYNDELQTTIIPLIKLDFLYKPEIKISSPVPIVGYYVYASGMSKTSSYDLVVEVFYNNIKTYADTLTMNDTLQYSNNYYYSHYKL